MLLTIKRETIRRLRLSFKCMDLRKGVFSFKLKLNKALFSSYYEVIARIKLVIRSVTQVIKELSCCIIMKQEGRKIIMCLLLILLNNEFIVIKRLMK